MRALLTATAPDAPGPAEKTLAGPGAYSIRLADIDGRLEHIEGLHREIGERLAHIERATAESNATLTTIFTSIRRHPLLRKFLGE